MTNNNSSININYNDSKKEKKEREPVVRKDSIARNNKSFGNKLLGLLISDDMKNLKERLVKDLIIPRIQNAILDAGEMIFFGKLRRNSDSNQNSSYQSSASYTQYGRYYRNEDDRREPSSPNPVNYENIVLKYRDDAERVVSSMRNVIRNEGSVTIADLYQFLRMKGVSSYVDEFWGWTDPGNIGIKKVYDGYLIDVAKAQYLG